MTLMSVKSVENLSVLAQKWPQQMERHKSCDNSRSARPGPDHQWPPDARG